MEELAFKVIEFVIYACRAALKRARSLGTGNWAQAEAVVTDDPALLKGIATTVEIPYSYRFKGELYTGLHEEPVFLSESDYKDRFTKGRHFIVRVKPTAPEVSLAREKDQAANIEHVLAK